MDSAKPYEEIVKKVEQVLVSEGLIPNGTVDCQAVAEQTTDAEIEGLTPIELQHFFTTKIYKMYGCHIDKHALNFVIKMLEMLMNETEIEYSILEDQHKTLIKLKYYYKHILEATKPSNLDQSLSLTAGMSGEQENRKKGSP